MSWTPLSKNQQLFDNPLYSNLQNGCQVQGSSSGVAKNNRAMKTFIIPQPQILNTSRPTSVSYNEGLDINAYTGIYLLMVHGGDGAKRFIKVIITLEQIVITVFNIRPGVVPGRKGWGFFIITAKVYQ